MGGELEKGAPKLWNLLGDLLLGGCRLGDTPLEDEHTRARGNHDADGDVIMMNDDTYWNEVEEIDLEGFINGLTADRPLLTAAVDKRKLRRSAILLIVSDLISDTITWY